MSISKHQRPRWAHPPRPPYRPITDEERHEDALVEERLHQLFGPPSILRQGNVVDWSWEQYSEALAQLEAEGLIPPPPARQWTELPIRPNRRPRHCSSTALKRGEDVPDLHPGCHCGDHWGSFPEGALDGL